MPEANQTTFFMYNVESLESAIGSVESVHADAVHANDKGVQKDCQLVLAGLNSLKASILMVLANQAANTTLQHREVADAIDAEFAKEQKVAATDV